MIRIGQVIGLNPQEMEEYKKLHSDVWAGVLAKIHECGIRNYTIFLREPEMLMFAYMEYHGDDWDADMAKMAADPETQRWWAINKPKQVPLESRAEGEWWASMDEIFHVD